MKLKGTFVLPLLLVAGIAIAQAPKMLKAGDSYFIPAGRIHDAKAHGGAGTKALATYVVEKGKPLAMSAPR